MRKSVKRGVILQKIHERYCATGKAITISELAAETGFKPQIINRMVNGMAKAAELILIGGQKQRQTKYLLPANALIAPGLFRLQRNHKLQNKFIRSEDVLVALIAIHLVQFYQRNITMTTLESYLKQMEQEPTELWQQVVGGKEQRKCTE